MAVELDGNRAALVLDPGSEPTVLIRLAALAADALRFIARTGTFFVRELPGLEDGEREQICIPLVRHRFLRVAP
jgi:hypothetical protein